MTFNYDANFLNIIGGGGGGGGGLGDGVEGFNFILFRSC
jgi:hypothetical protein